ncbi:MAG: serine/threonine protein kinase [Candidatus Xenobiia bacterium LiM19]
MAESLSKGTLLHNMYRIEEVRGKGASGFVYRAIESANPDRCWAVKEIISVTPGSDEDQHALQQFERECIILKTLSHPSLPRLIDTFSENNRHYLVMDFVDGESLQEILNARNTPFGFEEVGQWFLKLLGILEYLHSQNPPVVFRDLKPSNIMLTRGGRIKLIDFGIARHFCPSKMKDTFVMGTPGFSAPEQYGKHQTDPRSDVYSLAATVFYLLSHEDPEQFAFKFPPVIRYNPAVPQWFSKLLSNSLRYDPENRFSSVSALRTELEKHISPRKGTASSEIAGFTAAPAMQPASSPFSWIFNKCIALVIIVAISYFACTFIDSASALYFKVLLELAVIVLALSTLHDVKEELPACRGTCTMSILTALAGAGLITVTLLSFSLFTFITTLHKCL